MLELKWVSKLSPRVKYPKYHQVFALGVSFPHRWGHFVFSVCIREIGVEKRCGSEDRVLQTIPEFCTNPFHYFINNLLIISCHTSYTIVSPTYPSFFCQFSVKPKSFRGNLAIISYSLYPMISPTPHFFWVEFCIGNCGKSQFSPLQSPFLRVTHPSFERSFWWSTSMVFSRLNLHVTVHVCWSKQLDPNCSSVTFLLVKSFQIHVFVDELHRCCSIHLMLNNHGNTKSAN